MENINHISSQDRAAILKRLNDNGRILIVLQKDGRLRMYDPENYFHHKELMRHIIKRHQPWQKKQKPLLGPIGSKNLGALSRLSRRVIYER